MTPPAAGAAGWRQRVRATYAKMVKAGLYSARFRHADADRAFVADTLGELIAELPPGVAVLEAGCGVGDWIGLVGQILGSAGRPTRDRYGFDLTPEMIAIAAETLASELPRDHLRTGDLFDDDAYAFDTPTPFGLIYAYDVIQQLPPSMQLDGARALYRRIPPGGSLALFDQDAATRAGRRMAFRKAVTRYLRIPLVPRFYLVARYPRASDLVDGLRSEGAAVEVRRPGDGARVAVIARRPF